MDVLFGIIFIAAIFYLIIKVFGSHENSINEPSDSEQRPNNIYDKDFTIDDISEQLVTVNEVMEQIRNVEELITDIEICEPGIHLKVFTLSWLSKSGKNLSFKFWITGEGDLNTDLLKKLSYSERRTLRSLLKKEIKNLGERSYANVTQTMTKHDSRGVIYND